MTSMAPLPLVRTSVSRGMYAISLHGSNKLYLAPLENTFWAAPTRHAASRGVSTGFMVVRRGCTVDPARTREKNMIPEVHGKDREVGTIAVPLTALTSVEVAPVVPVAVVVATGWQYTCSGNRSSSCSSRAGGAAQGGSTCGSSCCRGSTSGRRSSTRVSSACSIAAVAVAVDVATTAIVTQYAAHC